jgi:hypothetical protein
MKSFMDLVEKEVENVMKKVIESSGIGDVGDAKDNDEDDGAHTDGATLSREPNHKSDYQRVHTAKVACKRGVSGFLASAAQLLNCSTA